MLRVVFFGGTRRGLRALESLFIPDVRVVGVVSLAQHEHESDRCEDAMAKLCAAHDVPVYETRRLEDRDYAALLRELGPDVGFVVGCRVRIPTDVLAVPPNGMLAAHDSLLPAYRGFAPLNWAILNREDHTGVTLFFLSSGIDEGDIAGQRRVPIGPRDTAPMIYERVCQATVELVSEAIETLKTGPLPRRPQEHCRATYTCSRIPEDGLLEWHRPTEALDAQVRALTRPYPGAFTYYRGRKLFVWSASR